MQNLQGFRKYCIVVPMNRIGYVSVLAPCGMVGQVAYVCTSQSLIMKIIRFVKQYPAVLKSVSHMLICIFAEHSHTVLNTRPSPYSLHTDPILCLKTNQPLCLFSPHNNDLFPARSTLDQKTC